jgi:hypothetical protein
MCHGFGANTKFCLLGHTHMIMDTQRTHVRAPHPEIPPPGCEAFTKVQHGLVTVVPHVCISAIARVMGLRSLAFLFAAESSRVISPSESDRIYFASHPSNVVAASIKNASKEMTKSKWSLVQIALVTRIWLRAPAPMSTLGISTSRPRWRNVIVMEYCGVQLFASLLLFSF